MRFYIEKGRRNSLFLEFGYKNTEPRSFNRNLGIIGTGIVGKENACWRSDGQGGENREGDRQKEKCNRMGC